MSEDTAVQKLKEFYRTRGIEEEDLAGKKQALSSLVIIPNFPYAEKAPCLYELEQQFIEENKGQE